MFDSRVSEGLGGLGRHVAVEEVTGRVLNKREEGGEGGKSEYGRCPASSDLETPFPSPPSLPPSLPTYLERIMQPTLRHTLQRVNVGPQFFRGRVGHLQERLAIERVGHGDAALRQGPSAVDWNEGGREGG